MRLFNHILIVDDINNKENILFQLQNLYTDEDFNGNNGEEYTWEQAIAEGFQSNQDYVINKLKNSDKTGIDLIESFFSEWLDSDYYYTKWELNHIEHNDTVFISVVIIEGD